MPILMFEEMRILTFSVMKEFWEKCNVDNFEEEDENSRNFNSAYEFHIPCIFTKHSNTKC